MPPARRTQFPILLTHRLSLLALACGLGLGLRTPASGADWNCRQDTHGKWVCDAREIPARAATAQIPAREAPAAQPLTVEPSAVEPSAVEPSAAEPSAAKPPATAATDKAQKTVAQPDAGWSSLLDEDIPWQRCALAPAAIAQSGTAEPLPITVVTDSAETFDAGQEVRFSGDVRLQQGNQTLLADQMRYRRSNGQVEAEGSVLLRRPDLRLAADQVSYNLRSGQGEAHHVAYRLPAILARGTAARAELIDKARSRYREISYSTCPPGNDDWQLQAESLSLDTAEGLGTARGARLSFLGVPVMYAPILTFPIDDRRRSGLLIPSFGYGDRHGVDLSIPYYFNLAPNYDLTLTPRLMSRRGVMLGGEFRFLTHRHQGRIDASFLPHDREAPASETRRGSLSLQTQSRYSEKLSSSLNINYVSDDQFLKDFGPDIQTYSQSHLERSAEVRYRDSTWSASAKVQQFQTVDPLIAKANRPYAVLPRLQFEIGDRLPALSAGRYQITTEFARFQKSGNAVEGRRLDLYPKLRFSWEAPWYFLRPSAGARFTRYQLQRQTPGLDSSPSRALPILALDGGLYFDRETHWLGKAATQSLEPRLFYLYVPRRNQNDIPIFDTSRYTLSYDNLFRENRFSGTDRVGDANQVTLALTSRTEELDSGRELLRLKLGQTFYFEDREVQLPGVAKETAQTSPLLAELNATLGRGWRTTGQLAWNPDNNNVEQALARLSYRADNDHLFSASYHFRNVTSSETEVSAIWPIGQRTRAIGYWNYSLSERRNLDALAGIEYGKCCWRVRALLRQQVAGTGNEQNLSFLLQLELKGLGKLGYNIDALLNDGIYGYRREDD